MKWRETNYLLLRRGPYVIAAGLDESIGGGLHQLTGRFVNLFDPELRVRNQVDIEAGSRQFLLDLDDAVARDRRLLASACKALAKEESAERLRYTIEGIGRTSGLVLLRASKAPGRVTLAGKPLKNFEYSASDNLLWVHFENDVAPRELSIEF